MVSWSGVENGYALTAKVSSYFYSESVSRSASVGLCFAFDCFLRSGSRRVAGGMPTVSRAIALTAFTARNFFGFLFFATFEHLRTALPAARV